MNRLSKSHSVPRIAPRHFKPTLPLSISAVNQHEGLTSNRRERSHSKESYREDAASTKVGDACAKIFKHLDDINSTFLDRAKALDRQEFGEDRSSEKRVVCTSFGNETTVSEVDHILGSLTLPSFGRAGDEPLPEAAISSSVDSLPALEFRKQQKRPQGNPDLVLHPLFATNKVMVDALTSNLPSGATKLKIDSEDHSNESSEFAANISDVMNNLDAISTPSVKICREPSGVSTTASPLLRSDAAPPMVITLGESSSIHGSSDESSVYSGLQTGQVDHANWIQAHRQVMERHLAEQAELDILRRKPSHNQVGPPVVFVEGCGQQPGQCVAWRLKVTFT